jgi:hypothetical protein
MEINKNSDQASAQEKTAASEKIALRLFDCQIFWENKKTLARYQFAAFACFVLLLFSGGMLWMAILGGGIGLRILTDRRPFVLAVMVMVASIVFVYLLLNIWYMKRVLSVSMKRQED